MVYHSACPTYLTTINIEKYCKQSEALETAMKLEASLVGETAIGMNKIKAQLANLTLQLQDIKKDKEDHDDLWCTCCHAS